MTAVPSVPADYIPARWVSLYTRNELRWLCEAQDARMKELRQIIVQLRARLERYETP